MPHYCEFRVRLLYTSIPLTRKFLLRDTATFADLHWAIQLACGWQNDHLHEFSFGRNEPRIDNDRDGYGAPSRDEYKVKLKEVFATGRTKTCRYTYDFGDSWEHEVKGRRVEIDEEFTTRLLDGEGIFPPEDCGGVGGFEDMLELQRARAEEKELDEDEIGRLEWLTEGRPASFDLAAAKKDFDDEGPTKVEAKPKKRKRA